MRPPAPWNVPCDDGFGKGIVRGPRQAIYAINNERTMESKNSRSRRRPPMRESIVLPQESWYVVKPGGSNSS